MSRDKWDWVCRPISGPTPHLSQRATCARQFTLRASGHPFLRWTPSPSPCLELYIHFLWPILLAQWIDKYIKNISNWSIKISGRVICPLQYKLTAGFPEDAHFFFLIPMCILCECRYSWCIEKEHLNISPKYKIPGANLIRTFICRVRTSTYHNAQCLHTFP